MGFDLAHGWHYVILHRPSAAVKALEVVRTSIDEERNVETAYEFLSCFVASLQLLDEGRRQRFGTRFSNLFPELQYSTAFPDTDVFFNHFFEQRDAEIRTYLTSHYMESTESEYPWDVLVSKADQLTKHITSFDPELKGTLSVQEILKHISPFNSSE